MKKIKMGVLVSGGGTNLQAIIDACESGKIDGEITFVGSDRPGVFGIERARKHGIPDFVVNYAERLEKLRVASGMIGTYIIPKDYNLRDIYNKLGDSLAAKLNGSKLTSMAVIESELLKEMAKYQYDLLVLAGFMRVLSPYFIDKVNTDPYKPRIMNIHPAILPNFPGMHGYQDTWEYGCTVGGCTVHFVDYGEDTGPIIKQRAVDILPGETLESFKTRGLIAEWEFYPECIQLFAENRLRVLDRDIGNGKVRKIVWIALADIKTNNQPLKMKLNE